MPRSSCVLLGLCVVVSTSAAAVAEGQSFADRWAAVVSTEYRQIAERVAKLTQEASTLPVPRGENTASERGWHSQPLTAARANVWAQVDLEQTWPIDAIALIPASGQLKSRSVPGYGFPVRFIVQVSDDPDFRQAEVVGDFTEEDVPNPGTYPLVIRPSAARGRFVRLTVTKAWPRENDWIVALGELLVLSGSRNVAAGRPVRVVRSNRASRTWNGAYLTDERSILGPPEARGTSPGNGYLAEQEESVVRRKWVQVDLATSVPVDEVRLFPARPRDFVDLPGLGFPPRFLVELSDAADMTGATTVYATGDTDFSHPGDNPVTLPAHGQRGRFLRVTALRLHDRGERATFALAEVEAWSGGRNVAHGGAVSYLDRFNRPEAPLWDPKFLTDGHTSLHPLLNWPEWLAGLVRRHEVERELASLEKAREQCVGRVLENTARVVAGGMAGALGLTLLAGWRSRRARRRALEDMQRRIAGDLHDEIGSYISSIGLLSDAARRHAKEERLAEDLQEIGRIARQTLTSLGEIVWLLDPKPMSRADLIARMREAAPSLTVGLRLEFRAPAALRGATCSWAVTRNVWLIFKEGLHNVAKHARAKHVWIEVDEPDGGLTLEIRDDGVGFDPQQPALGRGLRSLRERAAELRARLHLEANPGRGTRLRLEIPFR